MKMLLEASMQNQAGKIWNVEELSQQWKGNTTGIVDVESGVLYAVCATYSSLLVTKPHLE
jgi:hypothetical protein